MQYEAAEKMHEKQWARLKYSQTLQKQSDDMEYIYAYDMGTI